MAKFLENSKSHPDQKFSRRVRLTRVSDQLARGKEEEEGFSSLCGRHSPREEEVIHPRSRVRVRDWREATS